MTDPYVSIPVSEFEALAASCAEVLRLRQVLVEAAIPLEMLERVELIPEVSPELYAGVHRALSAIREALGATEKPAEPR